MSIEDKIKDILKELNIDYCSMFLNIEQLNNELLITNCYSYSRPNKDSRLNELIKEFILQNYMFNFDFKSALFVTLDSKEIKIEFTYPHIFYRKIDDVIKLK